MGINISVSKLLEIVTDTLITGKEYQYYDTEDQDWFDTLRFSGDKEFALNVEFVNVDIEEESRGYYRPLNFDLAIMWVKNNVVECNQQRLLNALEQMRIDEKLVFRFSY